MFKNGDLIWVNVNYLYPYTEGNRKNKPVTQLALFIENNSKTNYSKVLYDKQIYTIRNTYIQEVRNYYK